MMIQSILLFFSLSTTSLASDGVRSYQSYFHESYDSARREFRKKTKSLGAVRRAVKVPSKVDSDLTIDFAYFPSVLKKKLFILTSGIHGVEGFAGSAVQNMFLDRVFLDISQEGMSVLLVHSINPYGYKYFRRVSENNVDLNRNFSESEVLFSLKNEGYRQVSWLLNPEKEANLSFIDSLIFYFRAGRAILQSGLPALRQAVLQGQYEWERGLYFGGKAPEPNVSILKQELRRVIASHSEVLEIDLHTGYGNRGELHLFPDSMEEEIKVKMQEMFKEIEIDFPEDKDFYSVTGNFTGYIGTLVDSEKQKYFPMVFEFGTVDNLGALGSIRSIETMVLENQGHHFGFQDEEDQQFMKKRFLEMYYPNSTMWRRTILEQAEVTLRSALQRFMSS